MRDLVVANEGIVHMKVLNNKATNAKQEASNNASKQASNN
jgi:hypothetical protein